MADIIRLSEIKQAGLDLRAKEILKAKESKKICDLTPENLERQSRLFIIEAAATMGQKNMPPEVAEAALKDLLYFLSTKFFHWHIDEIRHALKLGATGEFGGDERSISSRTVIGWINTYKEKVRNPSSIKIIKAKQEQEELNKAEQNPTKGNTSQQVLESVEKSFLEYKKQSQLNIYSFVYENLTKLGLLNQTAEQKWDLIMQSVPILVREYSANAIGLPRDYMKSRLAYLDRVERGKKSTIQGDLIARSKELAVKKFFDDLIDVDATPSDLYEEGGNDA